MVQSNECHVCFVSLGRARRGIRQYCDHPYHESCLRTWRQTHPRWNGQCFYCQTPLATAAPVQAPGILERLNRVLLNDTDLPADEELKEVDGGEIVRRCPRCLTHFVRDGGCTHMTCRCGHEFYTNGISAARHRDRLVPIPDRALLWFGFLLGLALLLGSAAVLVRTNGVCEAIHADEVRESMCYPCFHELELLRAKKDDYEYCDPNDLSTAVLRYESARAAMEHVYKEIDCTWCHRTKTKQVEQKIRDCREQETFRLVWSWFPWIWIPVVILGMMIVFVVILTRLICNREHLLAPTVPDPAYRVHDTLIRLLRLDTLWTVMGYTHLTLGLLVISNHVLSGTVGMWWT